MDVSITIAKQFYIQLIMNELELDKFVRSLSEPDKPMSVELRSKILSTIDTSRVEPAPPR